MLIIVVVDNDDGYDVVIVANVAQIFGTGAWKSVS